MDTLTPEEEKARDYLVKRYGFDTENVPEHWIKAVAGYAAQEVDKFKEEIERQRSHILISSKALSKTLDERDNARIWVRSLQKKISDKNALLHEQTSWATKGMVDAFRGHDYRAMWEIWNRFANNLDTASKEADSNGEATMP